MDEADIKQQIKELLEEKFDKGSIFINHLMPRDSEEFGTVYSVEFKIMGRGVGMAHFILDEDGKVQKMPRKE